MESLRQHHSLSIVFCRSAACTAGRLKTASARRGNFALPWGQSRSSTAREHPVEFGRRGFDSHRARQFRRAAEFGLSVKRETASAFKPRTIGQPMDSHLASCPSSIRMGRCASIIELGSSTATEHLVKTRRCGFDSRPETSRPVLVHPSAFSTGRRIGLSLITTWSPVRIRPPEPNAGVAQW